MLPLVGSRIVAPGFNFPVFSASSIIAIAVLSLIEPVGFRSSNFAQSRTLGLPVSVFGESFGKPINGVCPSDASSDS